MDDRIAVFDLADRPDAVITLAVALVAYDQVSALHGGTLPVQRLTGQAARRQSFGCPSTVGGGAQGLRVRDLGGGGSYRPPISCYFDTGGVGNPSLPSPR